MKLQRHNAIRELLTTVTVTSQDELRKKLARRGFHVTQATLSRDIRDVLENFGLEVRQAQNLLVLVTATGSAQTVAAAVDYEDWPEVVGTIAGDDTVLVICANEEKASTLKARVEGYIG
jgi:transcriptional regulator of arginine metabolism